MRSRRRARGWGAGLVAAIVIAPAMLASSAEEGTAADEARRAVADLRERLGAALRRAMSEGGPAAAITVCREDAPEITASLRSDRVEVGRTSHRLRNPANAPRVWMKPLLDDYLASPPEPGSHRVVALDDGAIGYVEPIYLKPLCATCHGESIAPDLREKIRALYPEDRATGFSPGELRGLFWATVRP